MKLPRNRAHVVVFEEPQPRADGQGGRIAGWAQRFSARARYTRLRSGEAVLASRLEGIQTTVIHVLASPDMAKVTTDWRIRDEVTGEIFAITGQRQSEDRRWHDFDGKSGVAG